MPDGTTTETPNGARAGHGRAVEDIELAWGVLRLAKAEADAGERGPYHRIMRDIFCARRLVLGPRITALAEEIRTTDLGVTVTSYAKAGPLPGLSWWEWDARIPGRLPPAEGDPEIDRVGVLVEADGSGRRGTMHVAFRVPAPPVGPAPFVDLFPLACTFDWREDFEPPLSLLARATVEDVRRLRARAAAPTPAELEGSAVLAAAHSRRYGIIENPYFADGLQELLGTSEIPWHEEHPERLAALADEVMLEASLMTCLCICLHTVGLAGTEVRSTPRRKGQRPREHDVLLGYGILDAAV